MTRAEFSVILAKISRFYPKFYEGQDASKVAEDWYTEGGFEHIAFGQVERAVRAYCNTAKFPPTLADIKAQMVESYLQDKPTAMQAFQEISRAVKFSQDKTTSIAAYNSLSPILRKLVNDPSVLRDWNQVSAESFQTVVMSAIRESYKELATREAKYYAFPQELQVSEEWRIGAPEQIALPEPVKQLTYEERQEEMDRQVAEYREKYGISAQSKDTERKVSEFQKPMTKDELLELEAKRKREELLRMEWMKKRLGKKA